MQFNIEEFAAMNNLNSLLMNHHQNSSHHEIQNHDHFDPASSHDEFLEQMLSSVPSSAAASFPWAADDDHSPTLLCDQSTASKMRQHQIGAKALMLQQQLLSMPHSNVVHNSSFQENDESTKALFNEFTELLGQTQNQSQYFHHNQSENFETAAVASVSQAAVSGSGGGGAEGQPRQKVRARRGQATDPHSIAERLRRERIAERMKSLQEMVPNANKTDKASMLDEIIDYVKFLQLQVKVLSMSRLGGAAAVPPLLADPSSQGNNGNGAETASSSSEKEEGMRVAEQQVAKLMSDDMGAAMQYLQGKGLCLMPISLATAISTTTRNPTIPHLFNAEAGGPTSPSMSVLTGQSATIGGGCVGELATSISKP